MHKTQSRADTTDSSVWTEIDWNIAIGHRTESYCQEAAGGVILLLITSNNINKESNKSKNKE